MYTLTAQLNNEDQHFYAANALKIKQLIASLTIIEADLCAKNPLSANQIARAKLILNSEHLNLARKSRQIGVLIDIANHKQAKRSTRNAPQTL